jgi:two-component system sporulation sensor kinase A
MVDLRKGDAEMPDFLHAPLEEMKIKASLFDWISESSFVMIICCSVDGIILYISPAVHTILGYDPEEVVGRNVFDWYHPDDVEAVRSIIRSESVFQYRCRHKHGHYVWLEQTTKLTHHPKWGEIVFCINRDITESKRTRRLLLESQERYRSLIKYNPDGICSFDKEGRFTEVNKRFEEILGFTSEELTRFTYRDVLTPEAALKADQYFQNVIQGGMPEHFELTAKHKDGHPVIVECTVVPIVIEGERVGFYVIVKDITEKKKTAEFLQKSEMLSAIGQLAAGVAHEIRNPLTSLKGFLQLIQATLQNTKQEYFEIMLNELARIELIASEILVLAKPQDTQFKVYNIGTILRDVITLLNSQAILHNVQIITEFDDKEARIACDDKQLKQVFVNLIKNAIESMPNGGMLVIRLSVQTDRVMIQFIDHGTGIPEDMLSRLGEPFYTTKEHGTGLGLMITHSIVESHNGSIHFSSQIGVGTTVTLEFPLQP